MVRAAGSRLPRRASCPGLMLGVSAVLLVLCSTRASGQQQRYVPPASPRVTFNMNPGWKFIRQDVRGAEAPDFDDSAWATVSTPHTYNDVDSFDELASGTGERSLYQGKAWYRKHFKLPGELGDRKVFLEFEGMRQAGEIFLNGKRVGLSENGVNAFGLDITEGAHFGDRENVLAVRIDNDNNYREKATGVPFQWNPRDFWPNYGGINRNVRLHVTGQVYQTLPLFMGLETTGVYVYANRISVARRMVDVAVEAQVRNESGKAQKINLSAVVVDAEGLARAWLGEENADLGVGQTAVLRAVGPLTGARLWDVHDPYLYDVYSILKIGGKVIDVCKVRTGFRKTAFRGGVGTGGVYLNDRFVYLKGYAQRSTNEWAALGQAVPDWMQDFTVDLVRGSKANHIRWMHVSPMPAASAACDRFGILQICPGADKEKDVGGRQWNQRVEVMRATMIYLRNHPSILLWEAGNNGVSGPHMRQMREVLGRRDPHGGRGIGCRSVHDKEAFPLCDYFGTMVAELPRAGIADQGEWMTRDYSDERRDRAPIIEAEDIRDEASRAYWDDFSPPHFGFEKKKGDVFGWTSETYCLEAVRRYNAYYSRRISNTDPARSKWSGYASIIFSDTISHGRMHGSYVCRASGKVDAVRLPKQGYFAYRVMQNEQPDIHIIGHWTYPAKMKKTIHVVCNCPSVELFVNDRSVGQSSGPRDGYLFSFSDVEWKAGAIRAVGMDGDKVCCRHELRTAGEAKRIQMTAITGPDGLQADGSDVVLIDVEVVDAQGQRCPTDEGRIDFEVKGPGTWRGGYNSCKPGSINNLYLSTECGINRVAIRSTLVPGSITVVATRRGLEPGKLEVQAKPVILVGGLTRNMPVRLPGVVRK
jgi:beta-galactosidase